MAFPSREVGRDKLKEIFEAEGSFGAVYGYEVLDLGGVDKVLTIHSDLFDLTQGIGDLTELPEDTLRYRYWLSWYVLRDPADEAEDTLDTLALAVVNTVKTNQIVAGFWQDLKFVDASQPDYIVQENEQHRWERVLVEALIL